MSRGGLPSCRWQLDESDPVIVLVCHIERPGHMVDGKPSRVSEFAGRTKTIVCTELSLAYLIGRLDWLVG